MAVQLLDVSPAFDAEIGADAELHFALRTQDTAPFTMMMIALEFPAMQGLREVVFAGPDPSLFQPSQRYVGSTVQAVVDAGFDRWYFTVRINGLWQGSPVLHVYAVNADDEVSPAAPQGGWLLGQTFVDTMPLPLAPNAPLAGSGVECSAPTYDQAHFIETLRNSYPEDYFSNLEVMPQGGFEQMQAVARVAERASLAVSRLECCGFIMSAHGGQRATGAVEFFRESAVDGAITLLAGTKVRASKSGRDFVTLEDVVFGALELGPKTAQIQAVAMGYEYNVPGTLTTAGGEQLPGEIDTIQLVKSAGDAIDRNMQVRQPAPTDGGRSACLDALGQDLEIPRLPGEDDDTYRVRIYEVPDTVSPEAVRRGVNKLLASYDSAVCLRESGSLLLPGFYYDAGSSADALQDPARNFAYDFDFSVRPEDRFKLMLDLLDSRAFMLIGVPKEIRLQYGFTYDGSDLDTHRLQNAYDTTAENALSAAYDGQTLLDSTLYQGIWSVVDAKRAGGVRFDLYIEEIGCF